MRPKNKNGKITSLNLDEKELELMEFDKGRMGINSSSEYVGWLIRNRNYLTNPAEHLKNLEKQEEELNKQILEIKKQRDIAIKNLELIKNIEIEKSKKRPEAIRNIKRKMQEEGIIEAEQVAKTWGFMLEVPHTELLSEAMIQLKLSNKQ